MIRGTIHKTETGWVVRKTGNDEGIRFAVDYPIDPQYEKCYLLDEDAEGGEVRFEIVTIDAGDNGVRYAKLVRPEGRAMKTHTKEMITEIMNADAEDGLYDVEKLAEEYVKNIDAPGEKVTRKVCFTDGYNRAKTLNNYNEPFDVFAAFEAGMSEAEKTLYTEADIDRLLALYGDDAPASYIKRDWKKYINQIKNTQNETKRIN